MRGKKKIIKYLTLLIFITTNLFAQEYSYLTLGLRSTFSTFSDDGNGIGSGGHIRIPITKKVNTEWFADYIYINKNDLNSRYAHIGWSVMFYPFNIQKFQPYVLAGHCFDYNKKELPNISKDRWGAAAQIGVGSQFNISDKTNLSLTLQYMAHLTKEITPDYSQNPPTLIEKDGNFLEGHLLITASLNFYLIKLWRIK